MLIILATSVLIKFKILPTRYLDNFTYINTYTEKYPFLGKIKRNLLS